jgi:hypothetical protein
MTKITQSLTNNNPAIKEFLNKFDTFLFDCDGNVFINIITCRLTYSIIRCYLAW